MTAGRARITRGLLACVVVAGSLALWTVVPIGWMYFTSGLVTNEGARFVLVMFGVPLSMALAFALLSRIDSHRRALAPATPQDASDAKRSRGHSLLEVMLVVSGGIALAALVLWWFLIADSPDPSGPLQPI